MAMSAYKNMLYPVDAVNYGGGRHKGAPLPSFGSKSLFCLLFCLLLQRNKNSADAGRVPP